MTKTIDVPETIEIPAPDGRPAPAKIDHRSLHRLPSSLPDDPGRRLGSRGRSQRLPAPQRV